MSAVRMIGIMNTTSEYKLSLPLAKNFERNESESRESTEVSKEVICEFIEWAVSNHMKCSHSYKYRETDPQWDLSSYTLAVDQIIFGVSGLK